MTGSRRTSTWTVAAVLAAAPACEDKNQSEVKPVSSARADSGVPRSAGIDKNIAQAVTEVVGGTAPGSPNGPPASGVFAPGAADKEIRMGDLPKLALGGKGEGPTVTFGTSTPKKKFEAKVIVSVQTGPRSALPTIELSVTLDSAAAAAPTAETAPSGPVETTFRVSGAKLASEQPGELPPGLDKQIGKFKGSKLRFSMSPGSGARLTGIDIAKDAEGDLATVLETAADTLSIVLSPYPTEPVGVGAVWMLTSRDRFFGLERVSYRMMKLQKIDGTRATVAANTKHYVVSGSLAFPGLPPHKIGEFNQTGSGVIVVPVAEPGSAQGENSEALLANLIPEGQPPQGMQPGQQIPLRFELRTKITSTGN